MGQRKEDGCSRLETPNGVLGIPRQVVSLGIVFHPFFERAYISTYYHILGLPRLCWVPFCLAWHEEEEGTAKEIYTTWNALDREP